MAIEQRENEPLDKEASIKLKEIETTNPLLKDLIAIRTEVKRLGFTRNGDSFEFNTRNSGVTGLPTYSYQTRERPSEISIAEHQWIPKGTDPTFNGPFRHLAYKDGMLTIFLRDKNLDKELFDKHNNSNLFPHNQYQVEHDFLASGLAVTCPIDSLNDSAVSYIKKFVGHAKVELLS